MPDWYRNTEWNDEVAAGFDAKLARSRGQRSQYLRIQGSTLKDVDPRAAIELFRRCIGEGDPLTIAHAMLDMAHAHYRLGHVGEALDTLEALLDQQQREPRHRTSAAFEYPFLVALHDERQRFDRAWAVLQEGEPAFLPDMMFEVEAARAILHDGRGEREASTTAARRALGASAEQGWIPGFPDVGVVTDSEHPLMQRLRGLAGD
ncbi:hypothetical protein GCM10022280_11540 [Sphingomonas swuensis]|uniref:Tetratricopeptide repeat protein n=1 Tax=Sphingomonas swuensis TaxID=977800 RepID=A0ABP7SPU9_9SPHN